MFVCPYKLLHRKFKFELWHDWDVLIRVRASIIANESPKPKRLHLEEDDSDGLYHCPMQACNHDGFTTLRGCRKHTKNKQPWYYYFDEKPNATQIEPLHKQSNDTDDNNHKTEPKILPN